MDKKNTRKGSTRKAKEEGWLCQLCKVKFVDENAELLECEYCSERFCRPCLKMSKQEYQVFNNRSDCHWYCPPCEKKAMKNLKIERDIEERCKAYFEQYEQRLKELEEKIDSKPDVETVKQMIDESREEGAVGGDEAISREVKDNLEEYKDSMSRRNNIIIFKAEEATEKEPQERKAKDMDTVNALCEITKTDKNAVKNVSRLGKRETDKHRPLRVIFDGELNKGKFMANLKYLPDAENENLKQLSISHDMTKKEREEGSRLYKLAQKKNEENESGDYVYTLKGPYWDRRMVKVKKKD